MRNIKLIISYDGTDFFGWQKQPEQRSVQKTISQVLSEMLNEEIKIIGASRTDSGVHAIEQTANFFTTRNIPNNKLLHALGSYLPKDIAVISAEDVAEDFNSRFSAVGKHYRYFINTNFCPDPFQRRYCWWYRRKLHLNKMQNAVEYMIGTLDWSGIKIITDDENESAIRTINKIEINEKNNVFTIDVYGINFMYKQVRSIVGILVSAALERLVPNEIPEILCGKIKKKYDVAPASGLFLQKVYYDIKDFNL